MCTVQDRDKQSRGDVQSSGREAGQSPLLAVFLRERECLRRIAAGMGLGSADVEDVLQDVSLQVLKQPDRFDDEGLMVRWLVRTTVNHCLSEHRRRFRRRAVRILRRRPDLGQAVASGRDTAEQAGLGEDLEIVRQSLAELEPSLLLVVVLRYFCDLDSTAIAGIVEMKASTVRSRLREARLLLAGKLLQRGIEP